MHDGFPRCVHGWLSSCPQGCEDAVRWAVLWKEGIDPLYPDKHRVRNPCSWKEYATEAEANAEYERLLEVRRGEIGWSREGGVYHPEWAITVYKPMEVRHGE